jgi:hypothetical protein
MICNICNQDMPILVPSIVQSPPAQGQSPDAHTHMNICSACLIGITNKWMMQKQQQQGRK